MFDETSHDFGNVPRGAKTEFRFSLTNKYEEDVHIASVRSSCGCTLPRIEKDLLKTYETGAIVCEFNTRSFIGGKSAVVTVVFDRPYYGEMQLLVKGNIRSDIVTEPGQIQFGEVDRGTEKSTSVLVSYAGTNNWMIKDVRSTNQNLAVRLDRLADRNGRVEYEMAVRLKDEAPAGEFNDEIVLVTNDGQYNLVTIPVRGKVLPPLMTSPVPLGTLRVGQSVSNKFLIVRSKSPFEIKKVECDDQRLNLQDPIAIAGGTAYRIPFTFEAKQPIGAFQESVVVYTSLEEDGVATTMISGNVVE
ncbi:MAG: DUF1573 domain-containing protein [bacterium]|nr:DUF1573 domain-containing protein [bacterium]